MTTAPAETPTREVFPQVKRAGRSGKFYIHPGGHSLWSVTTIIGGALPKPALPYWAARSTAEYVTESLSPVLALSEELARASRRSPKMIASLAAHFTGDSIAGMLADAGSESPTHAKSKSAAIDRLKGAPWRYTKSRIDVGQEVHRRLEYLLKGQPLPPIEDPEIEEYMHGAEQFFKDHQPEVLASELAVYNVEQSYAGQADGILRLQTGETVVFDFKTGKDIYPEVCLQVAAYRRATEMHRPDGTTEPMTPTDGGVAIHLQPNSYRVVPLRTDDEAFTSFLYAREVYRWVNDLSSGAVGPDLMPGMSVEETMQASIARAQGSK